MWEGRNKRKGFVTINAHGMEASRKNKKNEIINVYFALKGMVVLRSCSIDSNESESMCVCACVRV